MLKLIAHAKINLFLDVHDKRPDGYHNVSTIMQNVTLADEITLLPHESGVDVVYQDYPVSDFKHDLIISAWRALAERTGRDMSFSASVKKVIPAAAGLGGGSADAAATLIGLNELFELHLSDAQLREIAASIGADVSFFINGGTALAVGAGEVLSPKPPLPDCEVVIIKPAIDIATDRAYQDLDEFTEPIESTGPEALLTALSTGDYTGVCRALFNSFEPVIMAKHPEVRKVKEAALAAGADAALMSGSGSTVFALTRSLTTREHIAAAAKDIGARAYAAKPCNAGVVVVD